MRLVCYGPHKENLPIFLHKETIFKIYQYPEYKGLARKNGRVQVVPTSAPTGVLSHKNRNNTVKQLRNLKCCDWNTNIKHQWNKPKHIESIPMSEDPRLQRILQGLQRCYLKLTEKKIRES